MQTIIENILKQKQDNCTTATKRDRKKSLASNAMHINFVQLRNKVNQGCKSIALKASDDFLFFCGSPNYIPYCALKPFPLHNKWFQFITKVETDLCKSEGNLQVFICIGSRFWCKGEEDDKYGCHYKGERANIVMNTMFILT